MTPQEAEIIRTVFDRLKAAGTQPRDAEAEGLVEALMRADPSAGLGLVRALVITDRAQAALVAENETLKQDLEAARAQAGGQAQPSGGLFGGGPWGAPSAPAPSQGGPWGGRVPDAGPWGGQPQGGGFLSSALRTGAGVAGGLFAFEALKGLFGGGSHGAQTAGLGGGSAYDASNAKGLFDGPQTTPTAAPAVSAPAEPASTDDGKSANDAADGGFFDTASHDGGGDDFGFDDDFG